MFTGMKQTRAVGLSTVPTAASDWNGFPTPVIACNCDDVSGGLTNFITALKAGEIGTPGYSQAGPNGRSSVLTSGAVGFNFGSAETDGSFSTFIYFKTGVTTGTQRAVFGKRLSNGVGFNCVYRPATDKLRVTIEDATHTANIDSVDTFPQGVWKFAAVVFDRTAGKLRIESENATAELDISSYATIGNTENFQLGISNSLNAQNLFISYFAKWNVALTREQFLSLAGVF